MDDFLDKFFPDVDQNLEILSEECAEVIQAKCKMIRFGKGEENIESLETEVGDLLALVDVLVSNKILNTENLEFHKEKKLEKMARYYHHPDVEFEMDKLMDEWEKQNIDQEWEDAPPVGKEII